MSVLASSLLAIALLAQGAGKPMSQSEIDRSIVQACLGEGGKPEECACGLKIARDGLSERQMGLFPILWPIVKSEGDFATKMAAGTAAVQANGYTVADGLALMATNEANAARVEKECSRR